MPSYSDAILYVSTGEVDIDDAVLLSLKAEQYLLIQSCQVAVDQPGPEVRRRTDGKPFLTVYQPGELIWEIEARVAEFTGLANCHPGISLSHQQLSFINGPATRIPFQFEDDGTLVFERPTLTNNPGTLPSIAFSIRQVNGGFMDESTFPPVVTPPVVLYVDLPVQSVPTQVAIAMRATLLEELFTAQNAFAAAGLTATFYSGDPATTGTAVTTAATSDAWTDVFELASAIYGAEGRSPVITWADTSTSERIATHLRLTRNSLVVADIALAQPFTIPAYFLPRVPAAALGIWLAWPIDGGAPVTSPAVAILTFLMGGSRATLLPDNDRTLRIWDDDPSTGTELDAIDLTSGAAQFNVAGRTVNPGTVTGTNTAPLAGWAVTHVTIEVKDTGLILFQKVHAASITSGNVLTLADEPTMDLDAI